MEHLGNREIEPLPRSFRGSIFLDIGAGNADPDSLTGFGGGLETKRFLLELEGVALPGARQGSLF